MTGQRKGLPDGYEVLLEKAGQIDILIRSEARAELRENATREQRAGLEELVFKFANEGLVGITPKKWSGAEGWFPNAKASGRVQLQALKPFELKAYGFCCERRSRPTFVITGVDPSRGAGGRDQQILAAAGTEAFRVSRLLT